LEELDHLILEWLIEDMKAPFSHIMCRKALVISFIHVCGVVKFSVILYIFIRGGNSLNSALSKWLFLQLLG
jgi:hypothetical protein